MILDEVRAGNASHVKGEYLGHTLGGHSHAVQSISDLHSTATVCDKHELRISAEFFNIFAEAEDVDLIKRRLDLVEYTER